MSSYKECDRLSLANEKDVGVSGLVQRSITVPAPFFQWLLEQPRVDECVGSSSGLKGCWTWFMHSMIPPRSIAASVWVHFMFIFDLIYTAFVVPINVVFCYHDFGNISTTCTQLDIFASCIYILNLTMGFLVGAVLISGGIKKVETQSRRAVTRAYVRYGSFLMDAIAVIPSVTVIIAVIFPHNHPIWLNYVALTRMLRIFKLTKFLYLDASSGQLNEVLRRNFGGAVGVASLIVLAYFSAVVFNLEACLFYLSAALNGFDNSWISLTFPVSNVNATTGALQWYQAMYLVVLSSTTTGCWNIYPRNFSDMAVGMLCMSTGIVLFGFFISFAIKFATSTTVEVQKFSMTTAKLKRVNEFILDHNLPDDAADELRTYFQKEWANRGDLYKEDTMQLQLPDALRSRCLLSILEPLMMSVPILSSISSSSRQLIAAKMIHVDIGSGYEFCQEGDEPDGLWLLESGQAYVLDLRGKICFTLEAPSLFGDAIFISDQVLACRDCVWGYRASQGSKIWRLKLQDLTAILRVCPTVKTATYAYIQSKLLQLLCDIPGDYMYNEVVARVMLILEHAPPSLRDKAIDQIRLANRDDNSLQLLLDTLLELSTLGNVFMDQVDAAFDVNEEVRQSVRAEGSGEVLARMSDSLARDSVLMQKLGMTNATSMVDELTTEQRISDAFGRSSKRIIITAAERDSLGRSSVGLSMSWMNERQSPNFSLTQSASSRSLLHSASVGHPAFSSSFRSGSRGRSASLHRRNASTVGGASHLAHGMTTVEEEREVDRLDSP